MALLGPSELRPPGTDTCGPPKVLGPVLRSSDGAANGLVPALAAALTLSASLIVSGGSVGGSLAIGLIGLLCVIAALRPRWGLYCLVFLALLADHHKWGFSAWTHWLGFYVYHTGDWMN